MRGFLLRFLASKDEIDQHIAVWTLTQLLESNGSSNLENNCDCVDRQIQRRIRQTPIFTELLKTILREAAVSDEAIEDTDFEDESGDENLEEGNEVVNLTKSALASLKKLPTLEVLENMERLKTTTGVEGQFPPRYMGA